MSAVAGGYILTAPREEQERRGKIRVYPSGQYIAPLNPDPALIQLRDIAHHLACINRYTGGTPVPYSVGDHSIHVWSYFKYANLDLQRAALLHDASEYLINDMSSPVKHQPEMAPYREADDRITAVVFAKWGIPIELMKVVKPVDDMMFHREAASFFGGKIDPRERIIPLGWAEAERKFLKVAAQLGLK